MTPPTAEESRALLARKGEYFRLRTDDLLNHLRAALDREAELRDEIGALRDALERLRPIPERLLRGVPVRDLAEALGEADTALAKGDAQ